MDFKSMTIFGESDIPDCPSQTNGDYCFLTDKYALHPPAAAYIGKENHITMTASLPMYKIKADSAWGGKTRLFNCKFSGF
jgi:hypothetical protein